MTCASHDPAVHDRFSYSDGAKVAKAARSAKEAEAQADKRIVNRLGGGKLKILAFWAEPGVVRRGERALVCYGVASAKSVRIGSFGVHCRVMMPRLLAVAALLSAISAQGQVKPPSQYTVELQKKARETLPFSDRRDFEESSRGFLGAPTFTRIKAADGSIAWDIGMYSFVRDADKADTIHPSLARQAQLNMAYGLFEVVPERIYQVRGFDLANMTIIRGKTGWIVIDTLTVTETAKAAFAFAVEKLGSRPVVAVVFSHSHQDHFGGILGIVDPADVKSGKVKLIAPAGFLMHAVSENVFAGNAMRRRAQYQYGYDLPRNGAGHVDQAIGKYVANGTRGLLAPNVSITQPYEEMTVDGVRMVFQNTAETEAPVEMNIGSSRTRKAVFLRGEHDGGNSQYLHLAGRSDPRARWPGRSTSIRLCIASAVRPM